MRKIIKIIAIILGIILILLIVLPIAFRGRIVEMVKTEINENVDAQVEFGDFRLSLIRNFPNLSLSVDDILVVGNEEFYNDTLANIDNLAVTFDLMSLFRSDAYEVRSISLDNPRLLLKVLEDGTANWDIVKMEEDPAQETEPSDFKLSLQRVGISNGSLRYHDDAMTTYITARDMNLVLRGDLTADLTTFSTRDANIGEFSLRYETMPIMNRVAVNLTAQLDADLINMIFTFRENRLMLNNLPLSFDGMIGMPDEDILMDFTFGAPESEFRHFLSLVPAIYAKDFEQLTTSGTLALDGFVKGIFSEEEIPSFGINLLVNEGMFQYPDLPSSIRDVHIEASINNPGNEFDLTVIDVPVFRMNMAGNPFQARLRVRTPESDPQIDAMMKGTIDLGQVGAFYPLEEGVILSGVIETDMEARGRLSAIEQERYQDFHAAGGIQVRNLEYQAPELAYPLNIPTADFRFTPQFLQLSEFQTTIGESDLAATGRIDNIFGYLFDDQLLTGQFETRSDFFNLNQLMEETPTEQPEEDMELSVIKVPENIDFLLISKFQRILFGDLEITNVDGRIHIVDQEAILDNVKMNMLQGTLTLNGAYNTREDLPRIRFGMEINEFDIQSVFKQFNTVQILAPIGEFATGLISANLNLNSLLSDSLMPVLTTLEGKGSLRSSALQVMNVPAMTNLADQLNLDVFRELSLRNLNLSFNVAEGKVDVNPFDIRFGESVATISGSNFFDQRIDYLMNVRMPRQLLGSAANQVIDNLAGQAAARGLNIKPGETVSLSVGIGGTFTNPEVKFDLAQVGDNIRDQLREGAEKLIEDARDKVEEQIKTQVDETRDKLQGELDERANSVMEAARRQADNLRAESEKRAETIRQEARKQATRLENEASGVLAKAAARRAGEALVKEADQRANDLVAEADRNALRLISEAEQQADRIRAGEDN